MSLSPTPNNKTVLITGVSSGFGRAFAVALLAAGHRVIGTVRKPEACAEFAALHPHNAHAVVLDVTDFAAIEPTVAQLQNQFGPIDVLINNAGYGHEGTLEESPLHELIAQFNTNVFGAVAMIKAVLPTMRQCRKGTLSTSPPWVDLSPCPASLITAAANLRCKASATRWCKNCAGWASM